MSADNAYLIAPTNIEKSRWGIWYYTISGGINTSGKEPEKTCDTYNEAIEEAFKMEEKSWTEYGIEICEKYPTIIKGI